MGIPGLSYTKGLMYHNINIIFIDKLNKFQENLNSRFEILNITSKIIILKVLKSIKALL